MNTETFKRATKVTRNVAEAHKGKALVLTLLTSLVLPIVQSHYERAAIQSQAVDRWTILQDQFAEAKKSEKEHHDEFQSLRRRFDWLEGKLDNLLKANNGRGTNLLATKGQ